MFENIIFEYVTFSEGILNMETKFLYEKSIELIFENLIFLRNIETISSNKIKPLFKIWGVNNIQIVGIHMTECHLCKN